MGARHRGLGRGVGICLLRIAMFGLAVALLEQAPATAQTSPSETTAGGQASSAAGGSGSTNPPSPSSGSSSPSQETSPGNPAPANPPSATSAQPAGRPALEISQHDEMTTFKVRVNLVIVRVVVRDAQGHAVGNLQKDDFQLFDNRKPQVISSFALEQPGARARKKKGTSEEGEPEGGSAMPERYVAYVFDDVHLEFGDLARVRDAVERQIASLNAEDRAAVFTTSGQGDLDFTDDRALLHGALAKLQPRPVARSNTAGCPDISLYTADLIVNKQDQMAFQEATADALNCQFNNDSRLLPAAQQLATSTAETVLQTGEAESHLAVTVFRDVIRRMAGMPGQRQMLLLSPGFLGPQMESEYDDVVDRAVRAQVTISVLNARGLYTVDPAGDLSRHGSIPAEFAGYRAQLETDSAQADEDVLWILSDGTGGSYVHNSNDLEGGLRRIATAPEYFYMLGFSPQNLKLDGRFHNLKVTVKEQPKLAIQARKGYYAPRHAADPAQEAKQEIEEALFSQEELHELPVQLQTQFFKASDMEAKLAVLVHVDVKQLHFRKEGGRNRNDLTIVSGLFDRNGHFLSGNEKVLEMRLKDETLTGKLSSGITLKTSFDVKPGSYLVRLVVRDAEGQLAATNGAVEIP